MKLIHEDAYYCFPEKASINFLVENNEKEAFIKCLSEYFGKKKKNYCKVFNDDEERVLYDEIEFIYLPYEKTSIESNLHFSTKSILNVEITNIIENNAEKFQSIDRIRNEMNQLLSDIGIIQLRRILSRHLDELLSIELNDFDVSKLLEMLFINIDEEHKEIAYMLMYNLLFYLSRDKNRMVYIDFPINDKVIEWMKNSSADGIIFLADNKFQTDCIDLLDTCTLIVMSNKDYVEYIAYDLTEFSSISYMFHPFIQQNIELQNKKIMEYYYQLNDKTSTFYLMFNQEITQKTDK